MKGSGGFRFLWLLGGELDELEEDELDELDELERVLGWQGRFHPNRPRPRNGRGWAAFRFVLPGEGRQLEGGLWEILGERAGASRGAGPWIRRALALGTPMEKSTFPLR